MVIWMLFMGVKSIHGAGKRARDGLFLFYFGPRMHLSIPLPFWNWPRWAELCFAHEKSTPWAASVCRHTSEDRCFVLLYFLSLIIIFFYVYIYIYYYT